MADKNSTDNTPKKSRRRTPEERIEAGESVSVSTTLNADEYKIFDALRWERRILRPGDLIRTLISEAAEREGIDPR